MINNLGDQPDQTHCVVIRAVNKDVEKRHLPHATLQGLVLDDSIDDQDIYDSQEENDQEEDNIVTLTAGDSGRLLVLLRACLTPVTQDDQWVRTNIFRSTCTIKDCVCSFVIDSGSCRNVISGKVVEKLGLTRDKHLRPYNLRWLNDTARIRIIQRAIVPFSIGLHYSDHMYYDIAPIDFCHLLQGLPWEFDRKIIHDGAKNIYSFVWDSKKIVLLPSLDTSSASPPSKTTSTTPSATTPPLKPHSSPPSTLLFSYSMFVTELRDEGFAFAVVPTVNRNLPTTIPPSAPDEVLIDFADVFPNELPKRLSPLRDIQHQIDLVPGATLPNRPHYLMIPLEHEELRRQIEDFLRKCHIKESLSPCAVPALLIPKKRWVLAYVCRQSHNQ